MRASRTVGKRGARPNREAKERFWREHLARQAAAGLSGTHQRASRRAPSPRSPIRQRQVAPPIVNRRLRPPRAADYLRGRQRPQPLDFLRRPRHAGFGWPGASSPLGLAHLPAGFIVHAAALPQGDQLAEQRLRHFLTTTSGGDLAAVLRVAGLRSRPFQAKTAPLLSGVCTE